MKPRGFSKKLVLIAMAAVVGIAAAGWWFYRAPPAPDNSYPLNYLPIDADVAGFDIYQTGEQLHLLTAAHGAESVQNVEPLTYWQSADGGEHWQSSPVKLAQPLLLADVHRGNDPQLAVYQQQILVGWQPPNAEGWGGGALQMAASADGGKNWQLAAPPADSNRPDDQGYFDLLADAQGRFHALWLDDREERGNTQGVRYAMTADNGLHWSKNQTLAAAACTCCWTQLVQGQAGLYALYRGAEPRDMQLLVSQNGGESWQSRSRAGAFDWSFLGCPHDGGGLAVVPQPNGDQLHALVWTGKEGRAGLYYLYSADSGASWAEPERLADVMAHFGRVVVAQNGQIAVVWTQKNGAESRIWWRHKRSAETGWSAAEPLSAAGSKASHPRLIAWHSGFRVFWTEQQQGRSRLASVKLDAAS